MNSTSRFLVVFTSSKNAVYSSRVRPFNMMSLNFVKRSPLNFTAMISSRDLTTTFSPGFLLGSDGGYFFGGLGLLSTYSLSSQRESSKMISILLAFVLFLLYTALSEMESSWNRFILVGLQKLLSAPLLNSGVSSTSQASMSALQRSCTEIVCLDFYVFGGVLDSSWDSKRLMSARLLTILLCLAQLLRARLDVLLGVVGQLRDGCFILLEVWKERSIDSGPLKLGMRVEQKPPES